MIEQKTCFVISPIGDKDSDVRRHADNFIKRIIQPSLASLNFKIIRVDQSFKDAKITDEIVSFIKNSELCVVDSINYNPNVMYELGRRHETGRPVLVFRPVGQSIIFDLKDIKHIEYDLDAVDTVIDVQNYIRQFVSEFDRQGFMSVESTANLDKMSAALDRVERRIDDVVSILVQINQEGNVTRTRDTPSVDQLIESLGVDRAFTYCVRNNMVRESETIFSFVEPRMSTDTLRWYLAKIASMGSKTMFDRFEREIVPVLSQMSIDDAQIYIGLYVTASNTLSFEAQSIKLIKPIIMEDMLDRRKDEIDNKLKSLLLNQLGRLYSGNYEKQVALSYYEAAILNDPDELVFVYNAADCAFSDGDNFKATHYADKLKAFWQEGGKNVEDDDHLSVMYKIYIKSNRNSDASWAIEQLETRNPLLAKVLTKERY